MGFHSRHPAFTSPTEIKAEICEPEYFGPGRVIKTATKAGGMHLWVLVEYDDVRPAGYPKRMIMFYLIDGDKKDGYAYKPIPASHGPMYYDCPLSFLDMAEVENEEWRSKVRSYHTRAMTTFTIGQRVMVDGNEYVVAGPCKRSWLIEDGNGRIYKCPARRMVAI